MIHISRRGGPMCPTDNIAQSPPFEGGFKGDVLLSIMVYPTTESNHSKGNIPPCPLQKGEAGAMASGGHMGPPLRRMHGELL
jgi:hypothetical protein